MGLLILTIHITRAPPYRRPGWTQGPGGVLTPLLLSFPGPQLSVGRDVIATEFLDGLTLKQLAKGIGDSLRRQAILILVVLAGLTFLEGKSTKFVFTWTNPSYSGARFKNILVLGINGKVENRAEFEDQLSAAITRPGIQAIPSYSLLPRPNSTQIDMNQLRDVIRGQNIDAVVTPRLVKVNKTVTYFPGQAYAP